MNRFLNMAYFIEVIEGKLNGSAENVEKQRTGFKNVSYVKKVDGKGLVSAPCQKFNIKRYMANENFELSKRTKNDKKVSISALPHKYIDEDVFGFMRADKDDLTDEQYKELDLVEQSTFKKNGKQWTRNITKKRKSRFMMSPLVCVNYGKVNLEWNVASTSGDSMPYCVETYSGIFAGISNVDIDNISSFVKSDSESEFRDYSNLEAFTQEELALSKEEKYLRINTALKGLQYLSIQGNQNNHLTDTTPKFIILAEYKWGNNIFQGIIKKDGIDMEGLRETLEENEDFRISDIWIGVSKRIDNDKYSTLKEDLSKEFEEDYIHTGTIKNAFDGYLGHLKETV
ncbi:DevR family CRISPR-associated autoregulator [Clostridium estertheticum]|uniref:DevR family CRISPR-associated autoregulator n=1 Tax=Clostridium estertheticum TaxID=238834 RepID=UPI001C0DC860|nr:DevR family CRISPR-associated autoregulator [Clostridium estertheticum]MBU3174304.1 DevR family CRISPR-associated autoregulator [Clostridium estertheticum]